MTTGADNSPDLTISLKASPSLCRCPRPTQQIRAGRPLEGNALPGHVEPVVQMRILDQLFHLGIGSVDVFWIARQRAPAKTGGPTPRQKSRANVGRYKSREREGSFPGPHPGPLAGCCCRSPASARPRFQKSTIAATCTFIEARAALSTAFGSLSCFARQSATFHPCGRYPWIGSWAEVWSVTMSGRTPRLTSSGITSAALPINATDFASPAPVQRSIIPSASSSEWVFSST